MLKYCPICHTMMRQIDYDIQQCPECYYLAGYLEGKEWSPFTWLDNLVDAFYANVGKAFRAIVEALKDAICRN